MTSSTLAALPSPKSTLTFAVSVVVPEMVSVSPSFPLTAGRVSTVAGSSAQDL